MGLRFYDSICRQILPLVLLSVFPGLGYLWLGWLNGVVGPAVGWYGAILAASLWGLVLDRRYRRGGLAQQEKARHYRQVMGFFYVLMALWALIFVLYCRETRGHLDYIAIFTQIGATTVVATFLYPDPRLYRPGIPLMMAFLVVYFATIDAWYGRVLAVFATILGGVLLYGAERSYRLLDRIHRQATHDLLTGLPNRQWFATRLEQSMTDLNRLGGYSALMLIDLDHFKTVNDSLGHETGDGLLREVARRLRDELPPDCHPARLGGDEFIVILHRMLELDEGERQAVQIADRLLEVLKQTYVVRGHHIFISGSIGVRFFSGLDRDAGRLIREADIAMYEAKAAGRDGVIFFTPEMSRRVRRHLEIERLIHFGLERREFRLVCQPIFDRGGRPVGVEALARWDSTTLGPVSPLEFIPVAEQTGLIIELGDHLMEEAFALLHDWHDQGLPLRHFAINVSLRQFMHQGFVKRVERLCERYLPPELCALVVFEITETVISQELDRVVKVMESLRALGIRLAMDDFGTGYSALGYLRKLPVDELKIDRSFVEDLETEAESRAMVTAILGIARFLHLEVVAEGIESAAQLEFLHDNGCTLFQGHHLTAPMAPSACRDFLMKKLGQATAVSENSG